LRIRATIGGGIAVTECANHLLARYPSCLTIRRRQGKSAAVPSLSGKSSSNSKRIRGGGNGSRALGKRNGILMPDGSLWTGFQLDWNQELSKEDHQTVINTRVFNKAKGGREGF
jgi:hypothetical protein